MVILILLLALIPCTILLTVLAGQTSTDMTATSNTISTIISIQTMNTTAFIDGSGNHDYFL